MSNSSYVAQPDTKLLTCLGEECFPFQTHEITITFYDGRSVSGGGLWLIRFCSDCSEDLLISFWNLSGFVGSFHLHLVFTCWKVLRLVLIYSFGTIVVFAYRF